MSAGDDQEPIIISKEDTAVPDVPERRRGPICPRCGGEVSPGARFCKSCGEPITPQAQAYISETQRGPICPQCGSVISPGASFCNNCGQRIGTQAQAYRESTYPGPRAYPARQQGGVGWLIFLVFCSAIVLSSPWMPWFIGFASYRGDSGWGFISGWYLTPELMHVYFVLAGGIIMLVCVLALLTSWFTASPASLKRGLSIGASAGAAISLIAVIIAFIYTAVTMDELSYYLAYYSAKIYHAPGMYACAVFALLGIVASVVLAVKARGGGYTPPVYGTH